MLSNCKPCNPSDGPYALGPTKLLRNASLSPSFHGYCKPSARARSAFSREGPSASRCPPIASRCPQSQAAVPNCKPLSPQLISPPLPVPHAHARARSLSCSDESWGRQRLDRGRHDRWHAQRHLARAPASAYFVFWSGRSRSRIAPPSAPSFPPHPIALGRRRLCRSR